MTPKVNPPCKGCAKHSPQCRISCKKYKDYEEAHKAFLDAVRIGRQKFNLSRGCNPTDC